MSQKYNFSTGRFDNVLNLTAKAIEKVSLDQYVPFENGITENSEGRKGQWSFFAGNFWLCVGTNSWLEIYGKEIIDGFEFIKFGDAIDSFVPKSLITGPNSDGIKGQWSFEGIYKYKCVAHNTWIKYAVQTVF